MIEIIRGHVVGEIFDYQLLTNLLQNYKKPRDKISQLLHSEKIIRIKKGLYVFGEKYRKEPISLETLANLIYGPSYISLQYALSFYGMIPERVQIVTSVTTGKNKLFDTPLGKFSYKYLPLEKYNIGIDNYQTSNNTKFLIASKEKALVDTISSEKVSFSYSELKEYLFQNLRIDYSLIRKISLKKLRQIINCHKSYKKISDLIKIVEEVKNE